MKHLSMIFIITLSTVALARPADDPKITQAKQHYESGLAHYNLQEYPQAIEAFEAAYRLKPDPVFLYNLAQSHRLANTPERALYFYRAYLRESPGAPNRREVEDRIEVLEKVIADKKSMAKPPDHTLPPVETREKIVPAKPVLVEPLKTPAASTASTERAPAPDTPVYKRWWLWTIVGGVAAGAAVGLGVGLTVGARRFDANLGTVGPAALGVEF